MQQQWSTPKDPKRGKGVMAAETKVKRIAINLQLKNSIIKSRLQLISVD